MIWFLAARVAALLSLVSGIAGLPAVVHGQPWEGALALPGLTWAWRLDVVASVLLVFMGLLGWVVARFCAVNLRGRPAARRVALLLTGTLASLAFMVVSADLVAFAVGWTVSGLTMTGLIARAGSDRAPAAVAYIRRHLAVGDLALWLGIGLAVLWFADTDRAQLWSVVPGWQATVVATLFAVACVLRSGLVPAHRWLPETAEAPSPVSALLHAGVVNGAGVLGVAAWPVFAASPVVLAALFGVGLVTVTVGVWAGVVRRDVKGRLAWSTTTQMGYMTVQLGLGLPAMALMHLVAHGCYKSWLFLRAGGAVERHSHRWAGLTRPRRQALLAGAAVVVAVSLAAPATAGLVAGTGLTVLVPVLLGVGAAALAGWHVGGLRRVAGHVALAVAGLAGTVAASYLWLLLGWESLISSTLPPAVQWSAGAGVVLVSVCAVVGVVVLLGCRVLVRRPAGALALALLPLALTPGRRVSGAVAPEAVGELRAAVATPSTTSGLTAVTAAVSAAAEHIGPAWPLRAMVAANPLAGLERHPYAAAVAAAERELGTRLRPTLDYFLAQYDSGRITDAHLAEAQRTARSGRPDGSPAVLVRETRELAASPTSPAQGVSAERLCHADDGDARVAVAVQDHAAVWSQLVWSFTGASPGGTGSSLGLAGPYTLWRSAAEHRTFDRATGLRHASAWARLLPADPTSVVDVLARSLGLRGDALERYVRATLLDGPGWAGHAAWRAREAGSIEPLVELVAVRMALDVLFAAATGHSGVVGARTKARRAAEPPAGDREADVSHLWQRAFELGARDWLVGHIAPAGAAADDLRRFRSRPATQSLWCIDVRSERFRRHLEAVGDHETFGFAGFFGAAVHHVDADGNGSDLCPALLEPGSTAIEPERRLRLRQVLHRTATSVSRHPLAALTIAEGGGALSGLTSLASLLAPARVRRLLRSATTDRGSGAVRGEAGRAVLTTLSRQERADLAHSALLAVGLVRDFARVLLVCGHGATVENNAFATAYECGACGGHPGSWNARILADALNDPDVRADLGQRGVWLPADTVAVAALHDTTTDSVTVFGDVDPDVLLDLRVAGERAAHERLRLLPPRRRRESVQHLPQRAADWAEPTPEWGLAGNAALVIGPRRLTRGTSLDGRVFLHSYEAGLDPDGVVLEQLLTAPLVVAQWINAQYYFSAVAPTLFGAGDKTTHNVIGDVGVVSGARGDLRSGLPWQALFRTGPGIGDPAAALVHEPLRLTVLVAAPTHLVRDIVTRHDGLRHLVANEWISLLVHTDSGDHLTLGPDLAWRAKASASVTGTRSSAGGHAGAPSAHRSPEPSLIQET